MQALAPPASITAPSRGTPASSRQATAHCKNSVQSLSSTHALTSSQQFSSAQSLQAFWAETGSLSVQAEGVPLSGSGLVPVSLLDAASVEASVGYYPGCIEILTHAPDRGGRQCQVGSLTGAVAS